MTRSGMPYSIHSLLGLVNWNRLSCSNKNVSQSQKIGNISIYLFHELRTIGLVISAQYFVSIESPYPACYVKAVHVGPSIVSGLIECVMYDCKDQMNISCYNPRSVSWMKIYSIWKFILFFKYKFKLRTYLDDLYATADVGFDSIDKPFLEVFFDKKWKKATLTLNWVHLLKSKFSLKENVISLVNCVTTKIGSHYLSY